MAELDIGSTLCGDLARLALQVGDGRLRGPGMLAIAFRATLLLDLAGCGAIEVPAGRDGIALDAGPFAHGTLYVDVTATGCAAADQLLDEVRRHPTRTMDGTLRRGRPHLTVVTRELVRDGLWTVRRPRAVGRRWADAESDRYSELRWHLHEVISGRAEPADEREAVLAAVLDVLELTRRRDIDEPAAPFLLDRFGSLAWLGRDVVEYLRTTRIRRQTASAAGASGGSGG